MPEKTIRRLPYLAAAALLLAAACLVAVARQKHAVLAGPDTGRPLAESALAELRSLPAIAVDDPAVGAALQRLARAPRVAYVWGIAADGRVFFANARFNRGDPIESHATAETRRILTSLPEALLPAEQRLALLTASAIQSEGEHNDVFGYLVRPLCTDSGTTLGLVGAAYSRLPAEAGLPAARYLVPLLLLPVGLGAYWLGLAYWVFLDARSRGEPAWVWGSFVLVGNLVALFAYLLVRPRDTFPGA